MKYVIFTILVLVSLPSNAFAGVEESWEREQVRVGEQVVYTLEYRDVTLQKIPKKGFLYPTNKSADTLPIANIHVVLDKPGKLQITVSFLQAGDFVLPISWQDTSRNITNARKKINVLSSLKGERKVLDIAEPIQFSGPYLLRLLFLLFFGIICSTAIAYCIYYFMKKSQREPVDAILQKPYAPVYRQQYADLLNSLLSTGHIPHKDFLFLLSGYIKERLENMYQTPYAHMSFVELEDTLRKRGKISKDEYKKFQIYFDSIKYMPNDELIPLPDAERMFQYWKGVL
ncbi:MAG: hypothetical protein AAF518_02065 [Spirochaetota bacterium]